MHHRSHPTPLGAIIRGALAGAAGTLAMDLVWYRRYQKGGGEDSFNDWEFSAGTTGYDNAGPPAQVGKRLAEGFLQRELEPETAGPMNNAVHWATGVGWGTIHAILFAPFTRAKHPLVGGLTGVIAWLTSYLVLSRAGIYERITEYDRETLWKDLSAHLVFGVATGTVFSAVRGKAE